MSKNFDDILMEVFGNDEEVYLEEGVELPSFFALSAFKDKVLEKFSTKKIEDKAAKKTKKAYATVKGGGRLFQEKLRRSIGQYNLINFRKIIKNNKEKIESIRKEYDIKQETFDDIVDNIVKALKSNDAKKIEKTVSKEKSRFPEKKEEEYAKAGVVDDLLEFFLNKANQETTKLQKQQKDFLKELYKKYGKDLVNNIMEFRKEILDPYSIIKRKAREAGRDITQKEKLGVSKKEWQRAKESGRKKIENRKNYGDIIEKESSTIKRKESYINSLNNLKRMMSSNKELTSEEKNKISKKMGQLIKEYPELLKPAQVSKKSEDDEEEDISVQAVKRYQSEIQQNFDRYTKNIKKDNVDSAVDGLIDYLNKLSGKYGEVTSGAYDASLLAAIQGVIFRDKIRDQLVAVGSNAFKNMYVRMLDRLIKEHRAKIQEHNESIRKIKKNIEFTDKEGLVWGKKKGAPEKSGNIDDYYLKIKEKDFEEGEKTKREENPEVEKAKERIQKAINDFKKEIKDTLSDEDYKKLQQYKLLDTIKLSELSDPKNLFKSQGEIQKTFSEE